MTFAGNTARCLCLAMFTAACAGDELAFYKQGLNNPEKTEKRDKDGGEDNRGCALEGADRLDERFKGLGQVFPVPRRMLKGVYESDP